MGERLWTLAQGFTDEDILELLGGERIWWCNIFRQEGDPSDCDWCLKEYPNQGCGERWLVKP